MNGFDKWVPTVSSTKGERVERPATVEATATAFTPLHASPQAASGRNRSTRMFALVAAEVEGGRRFAGHPVQPLVFQRRAQRSKATC